MVAIVSLLWANTETYTNSKSSLLYANTETETSSHSSNASFFMANIETVLKVVCYGPTLKQTSVRSSNRQAVLGQH